MSYFSFREKTRSVHVPKKLADFSESGSGRDEVTDSVIKRDNDNFW
jgi:hypothetical protein